MLVRMAMPVAVGAAAVTLGNFLNSEIVGWATDVPWAVRFTRYDAVMGQPATCRHPSQLYEFSMGLIILLPLYLVDRFTGKEKKIAGIAGQAVPGDVFCRPLYRRVLQRVPDAGKLCPHHGPISFHYTVCSWARAAGLGSDHPNSNRQGQQGTSRPCLSTAPPHPQIKFSSSHTVASPVPLADRRKLSP
jgi:hypothetical protein